MTSASIEAQTGGLFRSRFRSIFVLAVAIRIAASWVSHGQPVVDVNSFWQWAKRFDAGENPYAPVAESHDVKHRLDERDRLESERPVYRHRANYPPLWIYVCWAALKVSEGSGLSFDLVMKLLVSLFDAATAVAVGYLAGHCAADETQARNAALFYAINPASVFVASFHAQNDPIVIGLLAWASWCVLARPFRLGYEVGMFAVGLSLAIKPIALLYLPLLVMQIPGWSRRLIGVTSAFLPFALLWLPYMWRSPTQVIEALQSYRGVPDFGFIGIYNSWLNLGLGSSGLAIDYDLGWAYRPFCVLVLAMVWWRFRNAGLTEQFVAITLGLYLIYGRLAAQYLMWLMPFAAALRSRQLPRVAVFTSLALLAFYQLHHPGILTGRPFIWLPTGIRLPQWSGIFLYAHVVLYIAWFRWMMDLLRNQARPEPGSGS